MRPECASAGACTQWHRSSGGVEVLRGCSTCSGSLQVGYREFTVLRECTASGPEGVERVLHSWDRGAHMLL